MLLANSVLKNKKFAWLSDKDEAPFLCPVCEQIVLLRQGKTRVHRFVHKEKGRCQHCINETQRNLSIKKQLYESICNNSSCSNCKLEVELDIVSPDILFKINNISVAIEIIKKNISVDEIKRRFDNYTDLQIYVIFILEDTEPVTKIHKKSNQEVCNINDTLKFLHTLYFGKVYYFLHDLTVVAYHFDSVEVKVKNFNQYGGEISFYNKTLKSLKIPVKSRDINLIDNFKYLWRSKWVTEYIEYPCGKLWIDSLDNWW